VCTSACTCGVKGAFTILDLLFVQSQRDKVFPFHVVFCVQCNVYRGVQTVQNISLYTCYRQHLRTCTSKTAKITKNDIVRITLTVCQCAANNIKQNNYQQIRLISKTITFQLITTVQHRLHC